MLLYILNVLFVLVSISMVVLILMQRGSGAAAGSGFGGGASATVFGARGSASFLSKATKWLAIAFFVITLAMAMVQGGGTQVVIGVLITYSIVQFFQTYILEPLVVGAEVSINPLATIVGLVAFEILWGIPGMILAIPLLGMFKIVCDHVEPLRPYAYLIGSTNKSQGSGIKDKVKSFLEKLKTKIKGS